MIENDIDRRVTLLENEVKDVKATCKDINDRLIRMEETLKNNKYNTVDFKTYNQAIMEMSSSVKLLTDKVGEVLIKLDRQDMRITELERLPGKTAVKGWTIVATTVLTTVIGAIVGFILKGVL